MANKKTIDANVRKLANRGRRSIGLTLPMDLVKELKWKAGQKVVVKVERGRIVIGGWKK
jgi:antitoxin component of MazEF toxin-antitoxin module